MKRALVAAAAVLALALGLALAAPNPMAAQGSEVGVPQAPGFTFDKLPEQDVGINYKVADLVAQLPSLRVINAVGETCDGLTEPFDSGLRTERACFLKVGLERLYQTMRR